MTEKPNGREGRGLDRVLADLRALSPDIRSCAVLTREGRLFGSSHPEGVDRERAQAMLGALVGLLDQVARKNGKERAVQAKVRTELGYVLLVRLESGAILAAITGLDARVGLALYDMRNARAEVERALEGEAA
ncbi:MAG: roadblock/LC7 domain-containing protein [Rubrobacter sp.]|nr:roadblock/LC7 domain-containing protein [Rubrobacter sp.]